MATTIKDVARAAGVAVSTVSKVMSNSPTISDETKVRVRQIMTELGYHPNRAARALAQRSASNIGVLMQLRRDCAYDNPYIFEILCGVESVASSQGFTVTLCNQLELGKGGSELTRMVAEQRVDGLILHAAADIKPLVDLLLAHQFPFVLIGKPPFLGKFNWVDIDNEYAGYVATDHLLQCGYQRPGFVSGPLSDTISAARLAGYRRALQEHGLTPDPAWVVSGDGDRLSEGLRLAQSWGDHHPDAVVAAGNLLALGVLQWAKARGLALADEQGLITFDNHPLATHAEPPLTVVDVDLFELGAQAARGLFSHLQGQRQTSQANLLSARLIQRQTTRRP